jgi:microcystin-dependent protein
MSYLGFCPPGVVMPYAGTIAPDGWLLCNGSAVSRTTYAALFDALSPSQICNTIISLGTVTVQNSSLLAVGMSVFGPGIQSGATIGSIINATTITISSLTTASQTGVVLRFSGYGTGDGSTTFNLPDYRGRFLRGTDTMGSTAARDPNRETRGATFTGGNIGDNVGSIQADQMQGHHHSITDTSGYGPYGSRDGSVPLTSTAGNTWSLIRTGASSLSISTPTASDGTNGTPRTGSETRPANIAVNYIIKI